MLLVRRSVFHHRSEAKVEIPLRTERTFGGEKSIKIYVNDNLKS